MEQNYIIILIQSLEKKIKALEEISKENKRQKELLQAEELDVDGFHETIDKKSEWIEQINYLDDGFEKMYQRVKEALNQNKDAYQEEIARLKQLIGRITELTVTIQKEENDNRKLAEMQFGSQKKKVRQVKATKNAAAKYYQNMAKLNVIEPQFMDKKK